MAISFINERKSYLNAWLTVVLQRCLWLPISSGDNSVENPKTFFHYVLVSRDCDKGFDGCVISNYIERNSKCKFPKLAQSIFGLSEFWSAFRQIMAMDGRNSIQKSVQKWTEWVLEICSSIPFNKIWKWHLLPINKICTELLNYVCPYYALSSTN